MLKEMGSLQQLIFYAHYARGDQRGDPRMGWADVQTIGDLSVIMPAEVAREASELKAAWEGNAENLVDDEDAFRGVDAAIEELRQATLASLRALR